MLICLAPAVAAWPQATVKVGRFGEDLLTPYRTEPGVYLLSKQQLQAGPHVYRLDRSLYESLPESVRRAYSKISDVVVLPPLSFDSYHDEPVIPADLADWHPTGLTLYLVHFFHLRWDTGLAGAVDGAQPILWTRDEDRARLDSLVWSPALHRALDYGDRPPLLLQYAGPYHPYFKAPLELWALSPAAVTEVEVEAFRNAEIATTESLLAARCLDAPSVTADLDFKRYRCSLRGADVVDIARAVDVVRILPASFSILREAAAPNYLVEVRSGSLDPATPGFALQYDDGRRAYLRVEEAALNAMDPVQRQRQLFWHSDLLGARSSGFLPAELPLIRFNPQQDEIPPLLQAPDYADRHRLHLVQFLPRGQWPGRIADVGADSVDWQHAAQGAELLWLDGLGASLLEAREIPPGLFASPNASDPPQFLRYSASYHPFFKVESRVANSPSASMVEVEVLRNPWLSETEALIAERSLTPVQELARLHTVVLEAMLSQPDRLMVAGRPDVLRMSQVSGLLPAGDKDALFVSSPPGLLEPVAPGIALLYAAGPLADGSARLHYFKIKGSALDSLDSAVRRQLTEFDDRLSMPAGTFDTQAEPLPSGPLAPALPGGRALHVIQYIAHPLAAWSERVAATGAVGVTSFPSGGSVVWTDEAARAELAQLEVPATIFSQPRASDPPAILKFNAPFHPAFKTNPSLLAENPDRRYRLVRAEVYRHGDIASTLDLARALSAGPVAFSGNLRIKFVRGWYDRSALVALAGRADALRLSSDFIHNDTTQVNDSYRVLAPVGRFDPSAPGVQILAAVGPEAHRREVVRLADATLNALPPSVRTELTLLSDFLVVGSYEFDSQNEVLPVPAAYQAPPLDGEALFIVQFVAPPDDAWLAAVEATGARSVRRIDVDGYLVWADAAALAALNARLAPAPYAEPAVPGERFLQYLAPLHPYFRLAWWLLDPEQQQVATSKPFRVEIIIATHTSYNAETLAVIESAREPGSAEQRDSHAGQESVFVTLAGGRGLEAARELAFRPDLIWVGERFTNDGPAGFEPAGPSGPGSGFDPNSPETGPPPDPTAIPTLAPATLVLLSLLLVAGGWWVMRLSIRG